MFVINFAVSSMLHTNENKKTIADCARGGAGEAGPHPLVPLHRARALPTIILPSSCGNIYPFSSLPRPRDSSGDNPFRPFFFVRSPQISVALHDIALSKAFFLYSPLSALQKAFITLLLPSSYAVVGCVLLSRFAVVCLSQIFYIHCH